MFEYLRRDLARYWLQDSKNGKPGFLEKLHIVFETPQITNIAVFRMGSWIHKNVRPLPLRVPLKLVYHALEKATHALWGVHIDQEAEIGPGFYICHPGKLVIGAAKIGQDCNFSTHTVIGRRGDHRTGSAPKIGDRVYFGHGALLFGPLEIGSGATVGPLTVVTENVEPHTAVGGNPMKVVQKDWDNTLQIYGPSGPPDMSRA